jgi:hypothetical protein
MNSPYSYLKQTKCLFFFKNREQEGKPGPVWGVGILGGDNVRKGLGG